jgi:hypothetical protein
MPPDVDCARTILGWPMVNSASAPMAAVRIAEYLMIFSLV